MKLGAKLQAILDKELSHGNSVEGVYPKAFQDCKLLVILKTPFLIQHENELSKEIDIFTNKDDHYPLGKGYRNKELKEILMAPFH